MSGNKKTVIINAFFVVLNLLTTGIMFFFLYKILERKVGIEQVGLWSVILASSSIITLANFSLTTGLINFVSQNAATGNFAKANNLIITSLLISIVFFGVISIVLYACSGLIVNAIVPEKMTELACIIFPYSIFSLFINATSGIFISALEGLKKSYLKSSIYILSNSLFVLSCIFLIEKYGLKGAAVAQCIQALLVLILSFLALRFSFKNFSFLSFRFDKKGLREILAFTANYQVISLFQILFDPLTKIMMAKFPGGLALAGNFEMAGRLINQVRSIIISTNQVLVPVIAEKASGVAAEISAIYQKNFSLVFGVNLLLILPLWGFSPVICLFWKGHLDTGFIFCMYVIVCANVINIPSSPAYFSLLGQSILKPIIISHVMMGVLNFILALLLGWLWASSGVLFSWAIAWIAASIYLFIAYDRYQGISFGSIMLRQEIILTALSVFYACISYFANSFMIRETYSLYTMIFIDAGIFVTFICFPTLFYKKFTSVITSVKI